MAGAVRAGCRHLDGAVFESLPREKSRFMFCFVLNTISHVFLRRGLCSHPQLSASLREGLMRGAGAQGEGAPGPAPPFCLS